MSSPEPRQGRCLCGATRYRLSGPARNHCYCHCRSCQLAAGAHCVAWATVKTADFELLSGQLRLCHSSPGVTRGFCSDCGTALTYAHVERPGHIDFSLTTLEDPRAEAAPRCHIWVQDKQPWVVIDDELPQYPQWAR